MKRGKKISSPGAILVLVLAFFSVAAAQKPGRLISVYTTVIDARGNLIGGLTEQNFRLFEGKDEKKILSFSDKAEPMSIGFLIDSSASMTPSARAKYGYFPDIRNGIVEFMENSGKENEYFVISFNERINFLQEFTRDHEKIKNALADDAKFVPKGATKLNDGLYAALKKVSEGRYGKKALIIVSDAYDNSSRYKSEELQRAVGDSNTLLYLVKINSFEDYDVFISNERDLIYAVNTSGGSVYQTVEAGFLRSKIPDIKGAFSRCAAGLKSQYLIKFAPGPAGKKNEWRKIELKLNIPKDRLKKTGKLFVRARTGYFTLSSEDLSGQN